MGSARPFLPVVVLIIASALCSCTAEPPATPAGSQATATTVDPATKQLSWKLTTENLGKHHEVLVAKENDNGATQVEFDLDAQPPARAA
jgi:hypothetical protein